MDLGTMMIAERDETTACLCCRTKEDGQPSTFLVLEAIAAKIDPRNCFEGLEIQTTEFFSARDHSEAVGVPHEFSPDVDLKFMRIQDPNGHNAVVACEHG